MLRGRSSILFSATFLPIQYYKKLLGGTAEDYEVYMRGNTFFKLRGCPFEDQCGREGDIHYLIAAPNYVVDILSNAAPSVQLSRAQKA